EEFEWLGGRHELRAAGIRELAYRRDAKVLRAPELDREQILRVEMLRKTIRLRRGEHARSRRAGGHAELGFETAKFLRSIGHERCDILELDGESHPVERSCVHLI